MSQAPPALIDGLLPRFDFSERHHVAIARPRPEAWAALLSLDLLEPPVVRLLMGLRALPSLLARPSRIREARRRMTLADLEASGFGILAQDPPRELVLGVEGRFWRPTGNVAPFARERFDGPVEPGRARAVWNFLLEASEGGTRLSTETRIACGDPGSRRRFGLYWLLVRPGSGLIRRVLLGAVRRRCLA